MVHRQLSKLISPKMETRGTPLKQELHANRYTSAIKKRYSIPLQYGTTLINRIWNTAQNIFNFFLIRQQDNRLCSQGAGQVPAAVASDYTQRLNNLRTKLKMLYIDLPSFVALGRWGSNSGE